MLLFYVTTIVPPYGRKLETTICFLFLRQGLLLSPRPGPCGPPDCRDYMGVSPQLALLLFKLIVDCQESLQEKLWSEN